jgi:hypothetical protein
MAGSLLSSAWSQVVRFASKPEHVQARACKRERQLQHETAFGCFMMGPSATADIEATLVHGAQGARYGVVGTGVVGHFLGQAKWRLTTVGRHPIDRS